MGGKMEMPNGLARQLPDYAKAALGIMVVAIVDYATGIEIRVFPLYFLPLVYAAWRLGIGGALSMAALATVGWSISLYLGGREYSRPYIWFINFFTQGSAFAVVAVLFAKLHDALARERSLGRTDALTGLANSRSFFEQAAGVVALCRREARPVTIAYLDLDGFKYANDQWGHQRGDAILREVATVFRAILRASDVTARMGGDEFVILLPATDEAAARVVLEKVRAEFCHRPLVAESGVGASIGAVCYEHAPAEIDPMLKLADGLMYASKQQGKNRLSLVTERARPAPGLGLAPG